jgi:hypothetical protein
MRHDFESSDWADNHRLVSDSLGGAIDKLAYVVGSIIAHRRADERKARRIAQFGC